MLVHKVDCVSCLIPQEAKGEDQEAIFLPRDFGLHMVTAGSV